MPVTIEQFWTLLAASGLYSAQDCQKFEREWVASTLPSSDAAELATWLVKNGSLTSYQAGVLLSGKPGPFVFGPLVVTQRIQQGRLARLFRAQYEGAEVMLVPLGQFTRDASQYPDLVESAKSAALVRHPRVSRTYRATRQNGQAFIITESLHGVSLAEQAAGPRTIAAACNIALDVAAGLSALHEQNLVHGSVSPQNVLVCEDGRIKLLQFPLVPPAASAARFDLPAVNYLAPEWGDSQATATPAADIYSLGCLLFELIAGHAPFAGGNARQTVERQRREIPARLDELRPGVSPYLADLVDEMLAKDPALRCPSAVHVIQLLTPLAAEAEKTAASTPVADTQPPTSERVVVASLGLPAGEREVSSDQSASSDFEHADAFAIAVEPQTTRSGPGRSTGRRFWLATVGTFLVGGIVLAIALMRPAIDPEVVPSVAKPAAQPVVPKAPVASASVDATSAALPSNDVHGDFILVDDDRRTLWTSPTAGEPIELDYLPSGAQVIAVVRPAELLATPEGPKLLSALGPGGAQLIDHWRKTLGVEASEIEQLAIALVPDESLAPKAAYRMQLPASVTREQLLEAWNHPSPAEHAGKRYYQRDALAYFFPESEGATIAAIAPVTMMPQMLELEGKPLLRASVENLIASSDQARQLTLVLVPGFLLTDGQGLLAGSLGKLRGALRELVDDRIDAFSLSMHLDENLYLEFRAAAPVENKPLELLHRLRSRWEQLPERMESRQAAQTAEPYGRNVLAQFPAMLSVAREYTRGGVDDRQPVLSAYLPAEAAHNLLMGAELTLWSGGETSGDATAATDSTPARSAEELLAQSISFSFPRDTLDGALGIFAREIGMPIVIQGNDLQAEGITRNQSLNAFEQRNQPAAAILRKLLLTANPAGKLVYQLKADANGRPSVVITTRAAVSRRGEQPAEGF